MGENHWLANPPGLPNTTVVSCGTASAGGAAEAGGTISEGGLPRPSGDAEALEPKKRHTSFLQRKVPDGPPIGFSLEKLGLPPEGPSPRRKI